MLGVDVGGTFTDVVRVIEGRVEVTKVSSSLTDPASPVVEGARRLGVDGSAVFNHASTMGLNAVITRNLPKIGFLTTKGHRDILDRGRVWYPPANGGGGWGDPCERDPELVKRDVRDGYVTIGGAERDYGVVVVGDPENDPEGLIIDREATRRLRVGRSGVGRTSNGTAESTPPDLRAG